jgi:uncharacterized protein
MSETSPNSPSASLEVESSPSSPPNPQPRSGRLERFVIQWFIGPGGIRAGWRLAIFLAIIVALIAGATFIARTSRHVASPLENEVVPFLIVLFASWVMSRIEHRGIADYGLPLRLAFRSQFWQGIMIGFAAITVLLAGMRLAGVFSFGTIGLHGFELWKDAIVWGAVFLFVGFFEEFFFRGYPLFTLTTGMTFWPSAILLSALFGLLHHSNPNESWVGALEAGATGLLFCFLLRRTGNLWMPIGFHAAWDWGETYFYGVPNSGYAFKGHLFNPTFSGPDWLTGGTAGPEGSWLCIALLAILWVIASLWLRANRYPNLDAIRFPHGDRSVAART